MGTNTENNVSSFVNKTHFLRSIQRRFAYQSPKIVNPEVSFYTVKGNSANSFFVHLIKAISNPIVASHNLNLDPSGFLFGNFDDAEHI
jgi:hypothetical protein